MSKILSSALCKAQAAPSRSNNLIAVAERTVRYTVSTGGVSRHVARPHFVAAGEFLVVAKNKFRGEGSCLRYNAS